jgi:site-specific DNA-methyltransferase (adenine-specific)
MIFMGKFPDKYFDLAIVDPQTGQGEDKKHATRPTHVKQKNGTMIAHNAKHRIKDWDNYPPDQKYYNELFRVSKHQIIMCENYLNFDQKSISAGRIVWNLLRDNDFSACQIMWTSLTNKIDYFEFLWNGMIQGYQINNRIQQGNKKLNEKRIHPNQKPIPVYGELLKRYANKGDKILDTHLGSGSIRIACDLLGFDFYGCELDMDIFNDQENRFKLHSHNIFSYANAQV